MNKELADKIIKDLIDLGLTLFQDRFEYEFNGLTITLKCTIGQILIEQLIDYVNKNGLRFYFDSLGNALRIRIYLPKE